MPPVFDSSTNTKIANLRTANNLGQQVPVYEMLQIDWPSPTGTIYYAVSPTNEVASVAPPVSPIYERIIPDDNPAWFLPIQMDASIGDEEIDVTMGDADGAISTLVVTHGEGIKVTLLYWFPSQSLLLPVWYGHLRFEDEAEIDRIKLKVAQGFRSSEMLVPHRPHYRNCVAVFGGDLATQAEINEHQGCPYNRHLGGSVGNLNPSTGQPWTYCDRRSTASCNARAVPPEYHLSHATVETIIPNRQSSGRTLYSQALGNETNLKDPVRVVMGQRRIYGMKPLVSVKHRTDSNPNHSWFLAHYEACEGPIAQISGARVSVGSSRHDPVNAQYYNYRLGTPGQSPIQNITSHSYSGTAYFFYAFGWINTDNITAEDASASAIIQGLNNIRVYTSASSYTEQYTDNRVWQLMHILCNKRWGYGLDYSRFDIDSWIEAANWAAEYVTFTDPFGQQWHHVRSKSDPELIGRKVQQQVEDLCIAGRLSRPFLFNGKIHIVPLKKLSSSELAATPIFTDEGDSRNIVWEDGRSTLTVSRKSDVDLINRVECTFDAVDNDFLQRPLQPIEDVDAQLRAGRVLGDRQRKINPKSYSLLGTTIESQAIKTAWSLLDLGPLDEGGLQNNLTLKFKIWFVDALDLHPEKVIRVTSSRLTKYGFTYFRVKKMMRNADLTVDIECQAYNANYMNTFEGTYFGGGGGGGGGGGQTGLCTTDSQCDPGFVCRNGVCVPEEKPPVVIIEIGDVTYENGVLNVPTTS